MAEKNKDQIRDEFLDYIWHSISAINDKHAKESTLGCLQRVAFDILSYLDGAYTGAPKFIVAPSPHPEDKAFHLKNGEDYYPENDESRIVADIGGELHDRFFDRRPPDLSPPS